jgi:hypothetical protein
MLFDITTTTKIEISEEDQRAIAISFLKEKFNLKSFFVDLKTNKLCETLYYHSHNTWSEVNVLRDASEQQIAAQKILNYLKRTTT